MFNTKRFLDLFKALDNRNLKNNVSDIKSKEIDIYKCQPMYNFNLFPRTIFHLYPHTPQNPKPSFSGKKRKIKKIKP